MHLPSQCMLAFLRQTDHFMRFVEQLALMRRADDGLQAHQRHGDKKRRDDQERGEQLGMDRCANSRDPTHQQAERCSTLDTLGELFEFHCRLLR